MSYSAYDHIPGIDPIAPDGNNGKSAGIRHLKISEQISYVLPVKNRELLMEDLEHLTRVFCAKGLIADEDPNMLASFALLKLINDYRTEFIKSFKDQESVGGF